MMARYREFINLGRRKSFLPMESVVRHIQMVIWLSFLQTRISNRHSLMAALCTTSLRQRLHKQHIKMAFKCSNLPINKLKSISPTVQKRSYSLTAQLNAFLKTAKKKASSRTAPFRGSKNQESRQSSSRMGKKTFCSLMERELESFQTVELEQPILTGALRQK